MPAISALGLIHGAMDTPELRPELYLQLLKQLTGCESADAKTRYWRKPFEDPCQRAAAVLIVRHCLWPRVALVRTSRPLPRMGLQWHPRSPPCPASSR